MSSSPKMNILSLLEDKLKHVADDRYRCRCPLCGDSKKDPNKKRFYLKFNLDNPKPIQYKCFNCQMKGNLSKKVLGALIENCDDNILKDLDKINRNAGLKIERKYKLNNIKILKYNDKFKHKKNYIEKRLGVRLTYDGLVRLKAVLDLKEFLAYNNLDYITCHPYQAQKLDKDYVGFLTVLNDLITFRSIEDIDDFRHVKYRIPKKSTDNVKFYAIPNTIDVYTKKDIELNLAEGVYDILGVFFHIKRRKVENSLYAAILNADYLSTVEYFIAKKIVGDNVIINIYSDNDKDLGYYKEFLERVEPWVKKVNIFYNELNKDCGVTKDKIKIIQRY